MKKLDYIHHCLNILAYDSLFPRLSILERSFLHKQRAAAVSQDNNTLFYTKNFTTTIQAISVKIKNAKWERPDLEYDEYRELMVKNEKGQRRPLIVEHYKI